MVRFLCVFVLATLALPGAAIAADGRLEINQEVVTAAGGFPYVISQPGTYVLTGDLHVATDTSAILIDTLSGSVVIDLNGFRITGPAFCNFTTCPAGTAVGIGPAGLFSGPGSSVSNGEVSGFSGNCVSLGAGSAQVERLRVALCGGSGISAGSGSIVRGNSVASVGKIGISLGEGAIYAHNTVRFAGLGGGSQPAIAGGTATAGNYCDDGSCSPRGERLYYLTEARHDGSQARSACETGFHMASLWEILDVSNLHYDRFRGATHEDSGSGPPAGGLGAWIRTGKEDGVASASPGGQSCQEYTTTAGNGTIAELHQNWEVGFLFDEESRAPWWQGNTAACSLHRPVWCVQD